MLVALVGYGGSEGVGAGSEQMWAVLEVELRDLMDFIYGVQESEVSKMMTWNGFISWDWENTGGVDLGQEQEDQAFLLDLVG